MTNNNYKQLLDDYLKDRDNIANKNKLILSMEYLIHKIVNKYRSYNSWDYYDCIQAGWEGVIAAANEFDPDKSSCFSTCAYFKIFERVMFHIRKNIGISGMGLGGNCHMAKIYYNTGKLDYDITHSKAKEFADSINVPSEHVVEYLEKHASVHIEQDWLEGDNSPPLKHVQLTEAFNKALTLHEKGDTILYRRICGDTIQEISDNLGVGVQTISRMLANLQVAEELT